MRWTTAIVLILIVAFPVLWLLQMSLKTEIDAFKMPPQLVFVPTLQNYRGLAEGRFFGAFGNSTVVGIATTAISLVLGVPAAYALSRARFRRGHAALLWILFTRMAPPIAFGLPFFFAYRTLGLLDTLAGLVIVYMTFNLSLVIWMMRTFFEALPRSLEEAAFIDGAGLVQTLLHVTLPLSSPGLATTAIFCFLISWNDFFYALILTRTQATTAPVAIVSFMNFQSWEWGKITAGSIMIMVPVVVFALVVRRYLVQGLTSGALKG